MAFCTSCGHKLEDNQKFCTGCGKLATNTPSNLPAPKIKIEEKEVPTLVKDEISKPVSAPNTKTPTQVNAHPNRPSNTQVYSEATPIVKIVEEKIPQQPIKNYIQPKKSNSFFKKPWVITVLLMVCILGVLTGVFFKQVKGGFYLVKYNLENDIDKKFNYAEQALSNLNINSTYNAFKETSDELLKQNPDKVEAKLELLKASIKPEDYKKLSLSLYNEKTSAAVKAGNFEDALANLVKLQENGGNIRENKNYETIMFNAISKATGAKVYNNKEALKKEANIIFDNLDEDSFDEIIEIKDLHPNNDMEKQYEINLYKLKDNKYTNVFSEQTVLYDYLADYGIYNYDKSKKGLYVSFYTTSYVSSAKVYKVKDDKFALVGAVGSADTCTISDFDDDGIYEIVTTELDDPTGQYSHADMPRIVKYNKFADGSAPKVAKQERRASDGAVTSIGSSGTESNPSTPSQTNVDYIFPESNKRYLSESEVAALSKEQLAFARNEIYARHGYVFNTDKYIQYFTSKSWYSPNPSFVAGDNNLNQYEISNYKLIQKYEK